MICGNEIASQICPIRCKSISNVISRVGDTGNNCNYIVYQKDNIFKVVIQGKYDSFYIYAGVGYAYGEDKYSKGSIIEIYSSLRQAKSACSANDRCGSITDWDCDGGYYATYTGRDLGQAIHGDPCSWVKPGIGKLISIL